jgi:L-ascorbate metabolism protein UlaG (beta-lactamase superfamily)
MNISVTHIDTACVLIEINGYRILTDPTLDDAGHIYYHGSGAFSRKTASAALPAAGLGQIDLVLLSHHQHKDNFDNRGKEFALSAPLVLSTTAAAKAFKGITGLQNWQSYEPHTTRVPGLKITATPAQHRPWWIPEFISGKVIGFVIEFAGQKEGVIYIAGDTVYFKGIEEVARRFKIDICILNAGSVQFRYLTGFGRYTMDGKQLLKAARVLDPKKLIPVHHSGWSHFKEKYSTLRDIIATDSSVDARTIFLTPGITQQVVREGT